MILILSIANDPTTDEVINWIKYYNEDFLRINSDDVVVLRKLSLSDQFEVILEIRDSLITLNDKCVVWYRKGLHQFSTTETISVTNKQLEGYVSNYLKEELNAVFLSVFDILSMGGRIINHHRKTENNKLYYLYVAKSIGLKIPNTVIATDKNTVRLFVNLNGGACTKSPYEPFYYEQKDFYINSYTELITEETLNSIQETFAPTLLQQYIDKQYEIRVFYLDKEFFAMLISSQHNEQTKVDFRKYDMVNPNPNLVYKLPVFLQEMLQAFVNAIGLNCGSIDLLRATNGDYYFLEINPLGQFGMVSKPCNYYLEKLVAQKLVTYARAT